jgi:pyruvate dehydrogenase E2 component (dihydrolipoamide acetyltransferase)
LGVELASVRGSGPGGRVVRADIEAAARSAAEPRPYAESGPDPRGDASVVRPGQARRVAARRLAEAASAIPVFTLSSEIDMTGCATLRDQLAELVGDGPTPTVTDLVVAASGRALRAFPQVNSAYQDGVVSRFHRVNVGIAVDTPEALLVPTVTDADTRQLIDIAVRTRELAERARAGRITPDELAGATFTVSNLGMFGVTEFAAVINPPQAAILAVGAVRQLPRVRDGAVVVRPVMTVTLSCDHRVLDGAEAAHFLARIRETLERPLALLVNGGTPG